MSALPKRLAEGRLARPWLSAGEASPLNDAWSWAQALSEGNLNELREGLLQTSGRLFRDARLLNGELRMRHAELAERFYQQAKRLDDMLIKVNWCARPAGIAWLRPHG